MSNRAFLSDELYRFARDRRGLMTLQGALWVGAVSLGLAVLAAPLLQSAADSYAGYRALGVDRVLTGTVGGAKRITVRKSVLAQETSVICAPGSIKTCISR